MFTFSIKYMNFMIALIVNMMFGLFVFYFVLSFYLEYVFNPRWFEWQLSNALWNSYIIFRANIMYRGFVYTISGKQSERIKIYI